MLKKLNPKLTIILGILFLAINLSCNGVTYVPCPIEGPVLYDCCLEEPCGGHSTGVPCGYAEDSGEWIWAGICVTKDEEDCLENGATCTADDQCCSGICLSEGDIPFKTVAIELPPFDTCVDCIEDDDCGDPDIYNCNSFDCCLENDQPCQTDSDCCFNNCNDQNICEGPAM